MATRDTENRAAAVLARYRDCNNEDVATVEQTFQNLKAILQPLRHPLSLEMYRIAIDFYMERLLREGSRNDADTAQGLLEPALEMYVDNPVFHHQLVTVLRIRYERLGDTNHLEEATRLCESIIVTTRDTDPAMPTLLEDCAKLLMHWADLHRDPGYLTTAVELLEAALACEGIGILVTWTATHHLADAYRRKFELLGVLDDLAEAQRLISGTATPPNASKVDILTTIFIALQVAELRFDSTLDMDILGEIKQMTRDFLHIYRDLHMLPVASDFIQLGARCMDKTFYTTSGRQLETLNTVQVALRYSITEARSWSPEPEQFGLARFHLDVGRAHQLRFQAFWSPAELEVALEHYGTALRSTKPHTNLFDLCSAHFAHALQQFYSVTNSSEYLRMASEIAQSAVRRVVLRRARALLESTLAHIEMFDYEERPDEDPTLSGFDRAAEYFRNASRYSEHDLDALTKAIEGEFSALLKKAKAFTRPGDIAQAERAMLRVEELIRSKGVTFDDFDLQRATLKELQFEHLGDRDRGLESVQLYNETQNKATVGQTTKLMAAMGSMRLRKQLATASDENANAMAEGVRVVLKVISEADQLKEVLWKTRLLSSLAPAAAAAALRLQPPQDLRRVVTAYETARSVVWRRRLEQKASLVDLAAQHSQLARELEQVREDLHRIDGAASSARPATYREEVRRNRHLAAERYNNVLKRIQQQPGFGDFSETLPPNFDPCNLANDGPIVIFVHSTDCHAILITSASVECIPLPQFNEIECETHYTRFRDALQSKDAYAGPSAADTVDDILTWLWTAAAQPIMAHLGFTKPTHGAPLPRLWWVTSGWINLLPIHAAGDHRRAMRTGECCTVMDLAISSYTPSLAVLHSARQTAERMKSRTGAEDARGQDIAILTAMEVTPDIQPDLPNAIRELTQVQTLLSSNYDCRAFSSPAPERKHVVYGLRDCSLAHIIAHGAADDKDPLRSIIYLDDWKTKPLNVKWLMRMQIPKCQLVYLSGCEMAVNKDILLRDEGLHIAGALQMADVPSTVATWWQILDDTAVEAATGFYEGLRGDAGVLHLDRSAHALHSAMLKLRKDGRRSIVWAAYVHFGV